MTLTVAAPLVIRARRRAPRGQRWKRVDVVSQLEPVGGSGGRDARDLLERLARPDSKQMHRDPSDRDRGLASARRAKSRSRPPGDSGKQDRLHRKSTEALTRQYLPQHDVSLLDAVHHDPADLRRA